MQTRLLWTLVLASWSASSAWATPIILSTTTSTAPGTPAGDAFALAAQRVGALFSNPGPIFISVNFAALGPGILGSTNLTYLGLPYTTIRNSIIANANPLSAVDTLAIANLPAGPSLVFRADQANTVDSDGSANNAGIAIPQANARALGFFSGPGSDASITFSSGFSWDFDPSNGISGGTFDFVGVATHEILHALGFVSGVDTVDYLTGAGPGAPTNVQGLTMFTPLDLFRYSADSLLLAQPGILDLAPGGNPYFSLDGGVTSLGAFSTGAFNGDGRQASHWKDNLNLGIMDPTLANGELGVIRQLDLNAMDAIGWNLAAPGAPELDPKGSSVPLSFALVGLMTLYEVRRRKALRPPPRVHPFRQCVHR